MHTIGTEFDDLTVGSEYRIFGIEMWGTALAVLVTNDYDQPSWFPIGLFEMPAQHMPPEWEFQVRDPRAASGGELSDGVTRTVACWGYPELVRNPQHSVGLIESDPNALEIFNRELVKPPLEDWE